MRNAICFVAILVACTGYLVGQQELPPALDSGPLDFGRVHQKPEQASLPKSDRAGVYLLSSEMIVPAVLTPMLAVASPEEIPECHPPVVIVAGVIRTDGSTEFREVISPRGSPCVNLAIQSVKRSLFRPAKLNGRPIAVLACFRVPFLPDQPTIPAVQRCPAKHTREATLPDGNESNGDDDFMPDLGDRSSGAEPCDTHEPEFPDVAAEANHPKSIPGIEPPVLLKSEGANYSAEALERGVQGVVVVSMLVGANGVPSDLRVETGVGYGLDENAVKAAAAYRFRPAILNRKPLPVRVSVRVMFWVREACHR